MKYLVCSSAIGDTIVLAGAANYLAQLHGGLTLICNKTHKENIESFFLDTPVKVAHAEELLQAPEFLAVANGGDDFSPFLQTGDHSNPKCYPDYAKPWQHWFYNQLEIPYDIRWKYNPIPNAAKKVQQVAWPKGAAFLHDDRDRGIDIQKFTKAVVFQRVFNEGGSMLRFVEAIENAPEIHVIDSCFYHLVESLEPKGVLYLHRYARYYIPGWHDCLSRHKWIIIEDAMLYRRAKLVRYLRTAY